jgi:hypothetical protein
MWLAVVTIILQILIFEPKIKSRFHIYGKVIFFAVVFLGSLFFIINKDMYLLFSTKLDKFVTLLSYSGGTLAPNSVQILIFCFFILLFTARKIDFFAKSQYSLIASSILLALLAFYCLVISLSITTPPNSVTYAGLKLGLFIAFISLPLVISSFGYFLLGKSRDFFSISTFAVATFLILFNLGPPAGPSTSSYTQFGSPFGFINILQETKESRSGWPFQLLAEIENSSDRTVICFDSTQKEFQGTDGASCSKFATAIQGKWGDSFSWFWTMVNLNAATVADWEVNVPSNFYEEYKVFRFDKNFESSLDPNQIELAKLFPIEK